MSGQGASYITSYSSTTSVLEARQEGLLKVTFIGKQDFYECQVCSKCMSGIVPAQAHLKGVQHAKSIKKCAQIREIEGSMQGSSQFYDDLPKNTTKDPMPPDSSHQLTSLSSMVTNMEGSGDDIVLAAIERGLVIKEDIDGQKLLTCTVCKITCTGNVPMEQHLQGETHFIRQRKLPVGEVESLPTSSASSRFNTVTSCRQEAQSSDGLLNDSIREGIVKQADDGDVSHLLCVVCTLNTTGEENMKQHLMGKGHMKKVRVKRREALPVGPNTTLPTPKEPSNITRCPVSLPLTEDPLRAAKEQGVLLENESGFECMICSRFIDKSAVMDHLNEEFHKKLFQDQIDLQFGIFGGTCTGTKEVTSLSVAPIPHQNTPTTPVSSSARRTSSVSPNRQPLPYSGSCDSFPVIENVQDGKVYAATDSLDDLFD